jgi:hypothetical protein
MSDIASKIAWPIVVIVALIIFRKSIIQLFKRTNKVSLLGSSLEASQNAEPMQVLNENQNSHSSRDTVLRALGLFCKDTSERLASYVENETKLSEISDPAKKIEMLKLYSQVLYGMVTFERIYIGIYGSQIFLLEAVNITTFETGESLYRFYEAAKQQFPYVYQHYPYQDYLAFLVSFELIKHSPNDRYEITSFGKDFLKYVVQRQLNKQKLY